MNDNIMFHAKIKLLPQKTVLKLSLFQTFYYFKPRGLYPKQLGISNCMCNFFKAPLLYTFVKKCYILM